MRRPGWSAGNCRLLDVSALPVRCVLSVSTGTHPDVPHENQRPGGIVCRRGGSAALPRPPGPAPADDGCGDAAEESEDYGAMARHLHWHVGQRPQRSAHRNEASPGSFPSGAHRRSTQIRAVLAYPRQPAWQDLVFGLGLVEPSAAGQHRGRSRCPCAALIRLPGTTWLWLPIGLKRAAMSCSAQSGHSWVGEPMKDAQ